MVARQYLLSPLVFATHSPRASHPSIARSILARAASAVFSFSCLRYSNPWLWKVVKAEEFAGPRPPLEIPGRKVNHVIRFLELARLEVAETQVAADVIGSHVTRAKMLLHPRQGAEEKGLCGRIVAFQDFESTEVVEGFEGVPVFRAASSLPAFEGLLKKFLCDLETSFVHIRDRQSVLDAQPGYEPRVEIAEVAGVGTFVHFP